VPVEVSSVLPGTPVSPVSLRSPGPSRRQVLTGGATGALAVLLAASGCSRKADGPRLLTIPREDMGTFTRNFNPFTTNSAPMTGQAIYEPLLIVNPLSGEVTPWLADSWAMSDGATALTFYLRPGVTIVEPETHRALPDGRHAVERAMCPTDFLTTAPDTDRAGQRGFTPLGPPSQTLNISRPFVKYPVSPQTTA